MAIAGDIVANLTANTTGWTSALTGALTPLNVLGAAAAAFVGSAIVKFADVGSTLVDMSERTRVSAEQLSRYSYVANQTATSLESLQSGFVKMNKFMQEAQSGSVDATNTLQKMGLTLSELRGLTPDEQLLVFADAMNGMTDKGEAAALALKVFGKGAVDLIPLLNSGSTGIKAMLAEADRLGITMSQESAEAAEAFGDSIDRLGLQLTMVAVKIGSQFGPTLTALSDTFSSIVGSNGDWIRIIITTTAAVAAFALVMKTLTLATQAYAKAQVIAQALAGGPGAWLKLAAGVVAAGAAVYYLNSEFDSMNTKAAATETAAASFTETLEGTEAAAKTATAAVKSYRSEIDAIQSQYISLLIPASERLRMELRQMEDDWMNAANAGDEFWITWNQLRELQVAKIFEASGFTGMVKDVEAELLQLQAELDPGMFGGFLDGARDEFGQLGSQIAATEIKLRQMFDAGVPAEQINAMREALKQRDQLLSKKDENDSARRDADAKRKAQFDALTATKDMVTKSLTTPLEEWKAKAEEIQKAIDAGVITADQGVAFLEKEQKAALEASGQKDNQKAAVTEAIDIRSDTANRQLAGLLNRRGGGEATPQDKTNKLISESNAELKRLRLLAEQGKPKTAEFGRAT